MRWRPASAIIKASNSWSGPANPRTKRSKEPCSTLWARLEVSTPAALLPESLALVGAGKMGAALLGGWLALPLEPRRIAIFEPNPDVALQKLAVERGLRLNPPKRDPAAVVVLAIKPQMLDSAAAAVAPLLGPESLLISILAGKTIDNLAARLPVRAVVRAMP